MMRQNFFIVSLDNRQILFYLHQSGHYALRLHLIIGQCNANAALLSKVVHYPDATREKYSSTFYDNQH